MKKFALVFAMVAACFAKPAQVSFDAQFQKCIGMAYENPKWVYGIMNHGLDAIQKRSQLLLEKSRPCLLALPKESNLTELQLQEMKSNAKNACQSVVAEMEGQSLLLDGYLVEDVRKMNDTTARITLKAYTPMDLLASQKFLDQDRKTLVAMITMQTIQDQVRGQLVGSTANNPLRAKSFAWSDVKDEAMASMQCLMGLVDLSAIKMSSEDVLELSKVDQDLTQVWLDQFFPQGKIGVELDLKSAMGLKIGDMVNGTAVKNEDSWVSSHLDIVVTGWGRK